MNKKIFTNYIDFLQFANKNKDNLSCIKIIDNRLISYNTTSYRCKYLFENGSLTPSKFVKSLGIEKYSEHRFFNFSKIGSFAKDEKEVRLWYNGYFGGLIGVNSKKINDYIGKTSTFYDYDINSAYLTTLTDFLPSKFVKKITIQEFEQMNEIDKIPYIYFFEIKINQRKIGFFNLIGNIKQYYRDFDFINGKQSNHMIVSEKRLSLINQIYFSGEVKKYYVYVFERHKFSIYQNILFEYLKRKKSEPAIFKTNAMKLYGSFGQIYSKKITRLFFDEEPFIDVGTGELITPAEMGNLKVDYEKSHNERSSPQVAMWVADCVAEKLFNIISLNFDKIVSWNTDGITSIAPLNLKLSTNGGAWKLKKFSGFPFLLAESGSRVAYKNELDNSFVGGDCFFEKNGKIYQTITYHYSNLYKGFCEYKQTFEIDKLQKYNYNNTYRMLCIREDFRNKVVREYEKF